ncbi:transcriptional regulator [Paenibacillus mucilaginosus K02]|uniref:Transcriptional regulator n=2 Tax=Paenibacillus mucilaginosus TaxID=61624 RepID=I0BFR7_9BACL|nr:transcriptional regulator [Paenibacillus mucilaginosus K02]
MDQDFMNRFMPRIHDVLFRDEDHWRSHAYQVAIHSTRMCNLGFVVRGYGVLEVNGNSYELGPGCFYQISPPGSRMKFSTDEADPLLYIAVHFDYRLVQWEGMDMSSKESGSAIPMPHMLALDAVSEVEEQFRRLHQLWNGKQPGYEWRSRILLMELLDGMERKQAAPSLAVLRAEEAIRKAMEHIHVHYKQPVNRDQMARNCSMSVSYFALLFKKIAGYSYVNYVHKVRMDKAKILLRSGLAPISEVAFEVGYQDPLYFSKLFSREVGLSPREYRKG